MAAPFNFDTSALEFGTPAVRRSARRPEGDLRRKLEVVEGELADLRLEGDAAEIRMRQVVRDLAEAERKQVVFRDLYLKATSKGDKKMDDWDKAVELQNRLELSLREEKRLQEGNAALASTVQSKEQEVAKHESQIITLKDENEKLSTALIESKQHAEHLNKTVASVDDNLTKAYAELNTTESARQHATKAKDDAEARNKEASLEIAGLQQHITKAQNTIAELETQAAGFAELEREHANLQEELVRVRLSFDSRDREIAVKDARISRLENDLQKALEGKLSAEAAASAAQEPTATPQIIAGGDETLEAELAGLSDSEFIDHASTLEHLDYSLVQVIANIEPIPASQPSQLALGPIQSQSIAPTAPRVVSVVTRATQSDNSDSDTAATQTDPSVPILGITRSAIAISPIELDVRPAVPALGFSDVSSTINVAPVEPISIAPIDPVETAPERLAHISHLTKTAISTVHELSPQSPTFAQATHAVPSVAATRKQTMWSWFNIIALLLLLLLAWFWQRQQTELSRMNRGIYANRRHSRYGAFGHGRYLFGIFPIGFDIGDSYFSEQLCAYTSLAIAAVEDWAGINPPPLMY
ncbi:hypothetical protein CC80DRAFT_34699 [Byssothecium circinans]|uniref:Uncharacterized protein n=1 Tax=Byssothecium circinans TaxID=147558 RepID=A0A6A5TYY8_9PLEO|nr:hypothetical protein CC80DRAFT_34699 [Byssothecium circinans]